MDNGKSVRKTKSMPFVPIVAALLLVMLLIGCEKQHQDENKMSEDPPKEERLADIAKKKVVSEFGYTNPKVTDIQRTHNEWEVTVSEVYGYDEEGDPQFIPGGFHVVYIDDDGVVSHVQPGN